MDPFSRMRAARARVDQGPARPVHTFVAWNVQSLRARLKSHEDKAGIRAFLEHKQPDVVVLSELWLRRGKNGSPIRDDEDSVLVQEATNRGGCFEGYRMHLSLHSTAKRSGTALLWRMDASARPLRVCFDLPQSLPWNEDAMRDKHDDEGRIILAEFENVFVLTTYTPNNGSKIETYQRRAMWDDRIRRFLQRAKSSSAKPIVYMGDLNCAHTDDDLSHPDFFKRQMQAKGCGSEADNAGNSGQAGCTPFERFRFSMMLKDGELIDAYREKVPPFDRALGLTGSNAYLWGPVFTWRGRTSGKFSQCGMRIDHALVSKELGDDIKDVRICGTGTSCDDPSFMGSDHAPIYLRLRRSSGPASSSVSSAPNV